MSLTDKRRRAADPVGLAERLKQRVAIQRRDRSEDGAGGSAVSWSTVATVWAELRSRNSGNETAFGGKLQAEVQYEMTMRYRSGITADMRVSYKGRMFNIRRVDDVDAAGVILELLLEEGVEQ